MPLPIELKGLQGTLKPSPPPDSIDRENARLLAQALSEIAEKGVGDDPIRRVHDLRGIAERASNYVGLRWLNELGLDKGNSDR